MKSCREGDEGARYAAACELEATEANQQVVLGMEPNGSKRKRASTLRVQFINTDWEAPAA